MTQSASEMFKVQLSSGRDSKSKLEVQFGTVTRADTLDIVFESMQSLWQCIFAVSSSSDFKQRLSRDSELATETATIETPAETTSSLCSSISSDVPASLAQREWNCDVRVESCFEQRNDDLQSFLYGICHGKSNPAKNMLMSRWRSIS